MSDGYVKKLLDPAKRMAVMRTIAIRTGVARAEVLAAKHVDPPGGVRFDYRHVPSGSRIAYFDLRPETRPGKHLLLFLENQITSTQFTSCWNAKTLRPLFYLPYERNQTVRMKLSQPVGYTGPEVRFFTTAMMDGCSVYIEGPVETPKVTHSNANVVQPLLPADSLPVRRQKIAAKNTHMDGAYENVRKRQAAVVDRRHYIPEDLTPDRQRIADALRLPLAQVINPLPSATVLGFKDLGRWTFWLQQCVTIDTRAAPGRAAITKYDVVRVSEIWPNGAGNFRLLGAA